LQRGVIPPVIELRPPRQVILAHALDRHFGEVGVVHYLSTSRVRDGDDERLQPQGSGLRAIKERKRSERDNREHQDRHFEIGVGDDGFRVEFEELMSGSGSRKFSLCLRHD
jgi:hypothetical protein